LFIAREYSKDPRTKVGALVLSADDFSPHSFGCNGMPRKCDENRPERLEAPEKYFWFSHAEANAIANAAKLGIPLKGCWIVVTMIPCMDCARLIVQTGLAGVITVRPSPEHVERWGEHFSRTETLLKECGVQLEFLEAHEVSNETQPTNVCGTDGHCAC
jgi:dCMP deaminase